VAARSAVVTPAIALLDGFLDLNHAYRFGPPSCDLVVATLRAHGAPLADAFFFPLGLPSTRTDIGLTAALAARGDGDLDLTVGTRGHAHAVTLALDGFDPEDDFFHLAPGASRTLRLRRDPGASPARRGSVAACNALTTTTIQVPA
jgi:beta-mannosidase